MAEVAKVDVVPMRQRKGKMVKVVVTDGSGKLHLTFFNQAWRQHQLSAGMRGLFAGKVGVFRGQRQLTTPQTQLLDDDNDAADESMLTGLIPVYPATTKLPSWNVAKAVRVALDVTDLATDPRRLVDMPDEFEQVRPPHERLKFEEAFVLQVLLAQRRAATAAQPATARPRISGGLLDAFDAQLPFTLPGGQEI